MARNRTAGERIEDVLRRLAVDDNVWVATASMDGVPHLVPLSLAWDGEVILVATPTDSVTVRNAVASGRVRATLDSAADVVIFDTEATVTSLEEAGADEMSVYVSRVGWDPRDQQGDWSLLELTPTRVQAWNSVGEIDGRTIMRDGAWTSPETA